MIMKSGDVHPVEVNVPSLFSPPLFFVGLLSVVCSVCGSTAWYGEFVGLYHLVYHGTVCYDVWITTITALLRRCQKMELALSR